MGPGLETTTTAPAGKVPTAPASLAVKGVPIEVAVKPLTVAVIPVVPVQRFPVESTYSLEVAPEVRAKLPQTPPGATTGLEDCAFAMPQYANNAKSPKINLTPKQ